MTTEPDTTDPVVHMSRISAEVEAERKARFRKIESCADLRPDVENRLEQAKRDIERCHGWLAILKEGKQPYGTRGMTQKHVNAELNRAIGRKQGYEFVLHQMDSGVVAVDQG